MRSVQLAIILIIIKLASNKNNFRAAFKNKNVIVKQIFPILDQKQEERTGLPFYCPISRFKIVCNALH